VSRETNLRVAAFESQEAVPRNDAAVAILHRKVRQRRLQEARMIIIVVIEFLQDVAGRAGNPDIEFGSGGGRNGQPDVADARMVQAQFADRDVSVIDDDELRAPVRLILEETDRLGRKLRPVACGEDAGNGRRAQRGMISFHTKSDRYDQFEKRELARRCGSGAQ
jgi:hypothetical protein